MEQTSWPPARRREDSPLATRRRTVFATFDIFRREYPVTPVACGRILKFVSRAEHFAWRERWKNGRWVKLSCRSKETNR
jgi:hypothetical protein